MSIDDDIARFDWPRIQTYVGHAEMVPDALRGLTMASDDEEAARLGVWIEHILVSVAGPCEGCAPVATVLVAALPGMTPPGHSVALDLLSRISAAEPTGPAHEQIGAVDIDEIRQAVAGGFQHYVAVLRAGSSSEADLRSCVDLMDILAFHDRSLAIEAIAALKAIQTADRATDLAVLIENTLDDLAYSSNDSA
ncbi:hypothetical protein [Actinoplanes awajinensis]|uniref:Uncharacterized protein n=1 Tax=Actinoplanes awajinensis subsp. mycoplanecinus TaxID=135947 RepID=A0A101JET0_9ACTN|nr:hypothetical protein [Actinoplanes awajinensis]KUL25424.1 hypothetical protein ADL15_40900 [Actinoplanes awajinensis subsp. mycoplanecinus]